MARSEERPSQKARLESAEGVCLAICHDLRGPLATAGAAVHELARGMRAPAEPSSQRYLEIVRRSLSKADELLGALPELLAPAPRPLRTIRLGSVIEAVRDDLALELELCQGTLRVAGNLPAARGDPARLRIALRNLVDNAIRHRRPEALPEIVVRAWTRRDSCTMTISDNGRGLRRDGDASRPGLGIGVRIAREAIEASGGALAFSSRPGHGTTAAVTLRAAGVGERSPDPSGQPARR